MTPAVRRRGWHVAAACLLLLRVPSLVQPAGADQALYAYVGTQILDGGLPYRDAWDQKPPAIHFLYAAMYGIWRHDSVVAAADLLVAGAVAWMLLGLGRALTGAPLAGGVAASLFLLLGDPTLSRLAGVRVRSQCETFIAAAVTAALLVAFHRGRQGQHAARSGLLIGLLAGCAAVLKYNAAVYAPVAAAAIWMAWTETRARRQALIGLVLGFLIPPAVTIVLFAAGGALGDLYQATIRYNLEYSAETYAGPWSTVRYLATFPVGQARIDSLWTVGGLGCLVLLADAGRRSRESLLPLLWVAAAAASIAINGSRGLPQYFVQAAPALALAGGMAAARLWPAGVVSRSWRPAARAAGVVMVAYAAWRVTDFDKIPRNAAHDLAYMAGRLSREDHLARYGGREADKYIALSVWRLARYLEARTSATDPVYIFGFSAGSYVQARRISASRFFWSRPILIGFNAEAPGYGARGLLEDLELARPRYVVLQRHDWAAPPEDSATYFHTHPLLNGWLAAGYRQVHDLGDETFEIWADRTRR